MKNDIPKGPKPPSGSFVDHIPGRRSVKEYAVSEETLDMMGSVSTGSSIFLTFASASAGYAGSVYLSLSTAPSNISDIEHVKLDLMMKGACGVAVFCFFCAAIFIFKQKGIIKRIKHETIHDE